MFKQQRWSRPFWFVLACFVSSLSFLLMQGGKLAFMMFAIVATLCVYLLLGRWSGISSSQGNRNILLNSNSTQDIAAGSSLQVHLQVQIPGFWPIPYVFIHDYLENSRGKTYCFETMFVPDWKRRGKVVYQTPELPRGFYQYTITECSTEDIFGLFRHKGVLDLQHRFRVHPKTVHIPEWKQLHHIVSGMGFGSAMNKAAQETTQIDGIRDFVYGDRLSKIHWKSTAKTGNWKSKEFERESMPEMLIVLDCNRSAYEHEEQFEQAVSVASSLLKFGMRQKLSMGLWTTGNHPTLFDANRAHEHYQSMFYHLIGVAMADGEDSVTVLSGSRMRAMGGKLILLITPVHSCELLGKMNALKPFHSVCCQFWMTPKEVENDQRVQWLKQLRFHGHYGYAVRALQELPVVLGGGRL